MAGYSSREIQKRGDTDMLAVFDLDGTLVDSPRAILEAFNATFSAMGKPQKSAAEIKATIGLPLERAFGNLLGTDSETIARDAIAEYQKQFKTVILPKSKELVFDGVFDGLRQLSADGVKLAIATSKYQKSAEALLEAAGLIGFFSSIVGADRVTNPKPHPESIQKILDELNAAPGDTIMVGDTSHDVKMAAAAGVRCIAVTFGVETKEQLKQASPYSIEVAFADVVERLTADLLAPTTGENA